MRVILILIASRVFYIGFSTLPVYIICAFMVLYNLVLLHQVRGLKAEKAGSVIQKGRRYSNLHISLDLIALIVLLHFAGGIENPFIFLFVFHVILASIALHYKVVYVVATTALSLVILLAGLEYVGAIPHVNLEGFAAPMLYKEASYILAVLVALAAIL